MIQLLFVYLTIGMIFYAASIADFLFSRESKQQTFVSILVEFVYVVFGWPMWLINNYKKKVDKQ